MEVSATNDSPLNILNIQVAKGICVQKKGNVYEQVDKFKNLSRGLPKSL